MRHVTIPTTAQAMAEWKRLGMWHELQRCPDCDRPDVIFCMVHDEVWTEAGLADDAGWRCPPCLAKRLRRPLMSDDFDVMPVVSTV